MLTIDVSLQPFQLHYTMQFYICNCCRQGWLGCAILCVCVCFFTLISLLSPSLHIFPIYAFIFRRFIPSYNDLITAFSSSNIYLFAKNTPLHKLNVYVVQVRTNNCNMLYIRLFNSFQPFSHFMYLFFSMYILWRGILLVNISTQCKQHYSCIQNAWNDENPL